MKYLFIIFIFVLLSTTIIILHEKTSGGKKIMPIEKEVPLLETIEEIQSFKPIATIQYTEPIGPVRS